MPDFVRISEDVRLGENVRIYAFANLYGCSVGDEFADWHFCRDPKRCCDRETRKDFEPYLYL